MPLIFLFKTLSFLKKYIKFASALGKVQCSFKRENSSVGRASPCQGGGRGFESRFSLNFDSAQSPRVEFFFRYKSRSSGGIGRHAGLKILWAFCPCGFKSRLEYRKTL